MHKLISWIIDYTYMLTGLVSMKKYPTPPSEYTSSSKTQTQSILIIPGIAVRWSFMKPLTDYLHRQNYLVHVIPQLRNNMEDIHSSAHIVSNFISQHELINVIIVAHSKGGLIGKAAMNILEKDKIKGMVAIATPFSGSSMAKSIPNQSFQELTEESSIVHILESNENVNPRIISIAPKFDNHVRSANGSYLKGALKNISLPISGHHRIVLDKKAWPEIVQAIKTIQNI